METDKLNTNGGQPEKPEDKVIFTPMEEIQNIEKIINKLETTSRELHKVAKGMRPIEN